MTVAVNFNAVAASNARHIGKASDLLGAAQQRLASGSRVVDPSYDAAGAAIGAALASDVSVLEQAGRNAAIGGAVADFMIGALNTQMDILSRMRALASQSVSDSIGDDGERELIDKEFQALLKQMGDIASNTKWLGTDLLSSSATDLDFVVGLDAGNKVTISAVKTDNETLTLSSLNIKTKGTAASDSTPATGAYLAISNVANAIETVAENIAGLGAKKAELKYAADTVGVEVINKSAAKSTIVDADVTAELQNVQTQKALFDMSSAMFSKSLKKQDELAQMVKNA